MKYLLMTYFEERDASRITPAEMKKFMEEVSALTSELEKNGQLLDTHGLQPTSTATTVRVRNGKRMVTDGPFAETREALGGYFLIDVKTLDEAIDIAARLPSTRGGSTEIRPIATYSPGK
ncbi:MAG: YciI family protein [Myxococcota bacterium]